MSIEAEIDAWAAAHPAPPEPVTCDESPEKPTNPDLLSQPSGQFRPFPVDDLPEPVARFVDEIAGVKRLDLSMIATIALGVMSGAIGNARRLRLRSDFTPPATLWAINVAPSGAGKSPAMDACMKPLRKLQAQADRDHRDAIADWRMTCKATKRGDEKPDAPEPARTYYVVDATCEAIAARLQTSPRGFVAAPDEFAGLVRSFNSYRPGGDREAWLSFYDARAARIDRKAAIPPVIFIPSAYVACCGTIQPGTLRDLLRPDFITSGFAARLLLSCPPLRSREWVDADPSERIVTGWANVIEGLTLIDFDPDADEPRLVIPTPPAMEVWRAWWAESDRLWMGEVDPALQAWYPKQTEAAARIALICHLADVVNRTPGVDPDVLDEKSMLRGISIAGWYRDESRRIVRMLAGDDETDRLRRFVEVIQREGGAVRLRDWARTRHIAAAEAEAELGELIRAGLGGLWTIETRGRPATIFALKGVDPRSACDRSPENPEKSDLLSHCHTGDAAHAQAEPDDPERDGWLDHLAGQDAPLELQPEGQDQ